MNALFLPGNSKHNEEWIHRLDESLTSYFEKRIVHHYRHWKGDNSLINIDEEIKDIVSEVMDIKNYIIVAKSIGSVVATKAMSRGLLSPDFCLFLGVPLWLIKNKNIEMLDWLKNVNTKIIIVQNNNDPAGSYKHVEEHIKSLNLTNVSLIVADGATHDYEDFEAIKNVISHFMSEKQ